MNTNQSIERFYGRPAQNTRVASARWRSSEFKLLDISRWEFGRLHGEMQRFARQGWQIAATGEMPQSADNAARLLLLLARSGQTN